jgi:tRNA pseudouridine38-40 synthase
MTQSVALSQSIKRLICLLQYNGLAYHGSQAQQSVSQNSLRIAPPTIQGMLNQAFLQLGFVGIKTMFAGRTDTGVHALGQVAHADVSEQRLLNFPNLLHSLNSQLPSDIRVLSVDIAPDNFHAQQSALGKHYQYGLISRPNQQQSLYRLDDPPFVWHTRRCFDPLLAQQALNYLVGVHNFASFCRPKSSSLDKVCTIQTAMVSRPNPHQQPDYWVLTFKGNRFLYGMIRLITGLVLCIASQQYMPQVMHTILEATDFKKLCQFSKIAPAQGLCLMSVLY